MDIISTKKYKHLKEWRKHFKLSQEKLAEKLDSTQPTIMRWESGTMAIDDETFEKIAKTLGIEPIKLMVSPKDASTIDFLSKMNKIIQNMDDETKLQWISLGEKLTDKK
ncbi:helix-turn-helix domain-containing protein [Commensalibacter nepenthis]|uniref:Helix-turn-helix transcriptional regulator n=1 Tax=Commensalibacter nepenthis TaxID=3043872 RepID=A0ABT6Q815_9PROT|nr:helix-turn-helix transcriptional regulator [Commensalibacter sp. TBRC 10068]MDI2113045.1 helix-turn-helix transcriptional regulator [Commensalibacter sp. TBRC 10068]